MEAKQTAGRATWRSLVVFEALTLGLAGLSAFLTRDSMAVYETLTLPAFAPPGWAFPAAWSVLYPLMALAAWLYLRAGAGSPLPGLLLYGAQLAANVVWPLLFFLQGALGLAFVWLLLVLGLALAACLTFFPRSPWAGGLFVPYLAWLGYAAALNFALARLNP